MELGNKIKELRVKNNLTLEELGNILGCTKQSLHQLVHDKTKPSAKVLLRLILLYKDYFTPLDIYLYYFGKE